MDKVIEKVDNALADALRNLGYVKIRAGYSCGRHFIVIDGKVIAQTQGDDVWMRDEDVCDLARAIVPGCDWEKAFRCLDGAPYRCVGVELLKDRPPKDPNDY